jgi:hypothetical protein
VELDHLGVEGCLPTSKLVMTLSYPPLSVDLPGVGSRLLLLLISLLLIGEELHFWLGYHHPHHDRQDSLESRSVLQGWRGDDRVS